MLTTLWVIVLLALYGVWRNSCALGIHRWRIMRNPYTGSVMWAGRKHALFRCTKCNCIEVFGYDE